MKEKELLKEYGSPLYVYRRDILENKIKELTDFGGYLSEQLGIKVSMHYSTKANENLNILKIIKENGMAVDSMSPFELCLIEKAGFNAKDILYVCNNISSKEMCEIVDKNILLCLDSVSQVEMLGKVRPNTEIMVRINGGEHGVGHSEKVITSGKEARFGIWESDFEKLFEIVKKYNLKIIGIHEHIGSSFLDDDIENYIRGINAGLKLINNYFSDINILDLGGGFGVPYKEEKSLDFELLFEKIVPILKDFLLINSEVKEIKFEPGRYVVCESSYILGTVNSIKNIGVQQWIGTDIGMNVLIRPSMYDAYHKIEILKENSDDMEYMIANISGNVCESSDTLGKDRKVFKTEVGDVIKIYNTGAYGYSMSSNYTGRLAPQEVLIEHDESVRLIRRKESFEDIIKRME